ncbi:hypothetical protein, partial [Acidithiobacillus ferridurans]|uniref:hypothetical protein n=1 Tax=Acidithiobacillus ferridurans TaxID=1232575 RepID=UPI001C075AE0
MRTLIGAISDDSMHLISLNSHLPLKIMKPCNIAIAQTVKPVLRRVNEIIHGIRQFIVMLHVGRDSLARSRMKCNTYGPM